jgi:hypothetical protein
VVAALELHLDVAASRRVRTLEAEGIPSVEIWDPYQPGRWVPHRTLSMRVPNPLMGAAVRRCLEFLPISATVVGASVTDHANGIAAPVG